MIYSPSFTIEKLTFRPSTKHPPPIPYKKIDRFYPKYDVCLNGPNDYSECIPANFPQCKSNEQLCYNRLNRRDKFYDDKVPHYFIDYKRVLCYPSDWAGWGGCSSCTPGRWCNEEQRCILDEGQYYCPSWAEAAKTREERAAQKGK
mmetsp:Transcript_41040/g.62114  ORF Transcript_41040/g.62114 Transcript_41040/m.62114 type:complete len:146 (+) Transcript_41040:268-705(+)